VTARADGSRSNGEVNNRLLDRRPVHCSKKSASSENQTDMYSGDTRPNGSMKRNGPLAGHPHEHTPRSGSRK
jgi:hypothetical protein